MKTTKGTENPSTPRASILLTLLLLAAAAATGSHAMTMSHGADAKRPAATEFGLGPRASADGRYLATLEPAAELRPRRMQTVRVALADAAGRPIDGAQIAVDGGMPEHGHGLPTRPRVTKNLGDGVYEIEGLRFSMGGWWELRLAIDGAAGRHASRSTSTSEPRPP